MPSKVWDEITFPSPNLNGCTIEVLGWISNSILYFMINVIAYPCWDWGYSILIKGSTRAMGTFQYPVTQITWDLVQPRSGEIMCLSANIALIIDSRLSNHVSDPRPNFKTKLAFKRPMPRLQEPTRFYAYTLCGILKQPTDNMMSIIKKPEVLALYPKLWW